ncbi:hypothetical protein SOPP22_06530 [Shewanella sp. OPT22]|nr:hypothetical protein SOPP22_06530 [Shewanella sp. OPT22]
MNIQLNDQSNELTQLVKSISACQICAGVLPHQPRPVILVSQSAKILIVGQAPGRKVHETGIPFNDASGQRLREWLGVTEAQFYDPNLFAIIPMGFCFPGTGKQGDLPPRPECAKHWRAQLLRLLPNIQLTIVIGQYAQAYHFNDKKMSVTERVKNWQQYWPSRIPLPHPSPRNRIWLKRNPWYEQKLIPKLRSEVKNCLYLEEVE